MSPVLGGPGPRVRLLPCGDAAVLVEVDDLPAALALHAALVADPPPGAVDLVPAARTVLVQVRPGTDLAAVARHLRAVPSPSPGDHALLGDHAHQPRRAEVVLDVVYDGPDLDGVARHLGTSADTVVALHTGQVWTAAFGGFAPGFAYLAGEHERLAVPRLARPRTSVPAGSVGLAGPWCGVYPRSSPGGWQLVGRTDAVLFDARRDPPALLRPGTRVRFRRAGG